VTISESDWDIGGNHGYFNYTAYEINGDGVDHRKEAINQQSVEREPHTWIYSDRDIGKTNDYVLLKVRSEPNDFMERRAVDTGKVWWGGSGFFAGWIFALPGILIFFVGSGLLIIGFIGKKDTSIDRLLEEDAEFRKQQIALMQSARMSAMKQQKETQWHQMQSAQQAYPPQQPLPDQQAAPGSLPQQTGDQVQPEPLPPQAVVPGGQIPPAQQVPQTPMVQMPQAQPQVPFDAPPMVQMPQTQPQVPSGAPPAVQMPQTPPAPIQTQDQPVNQGYTPPPA
jgi:hypothetical protein